MGWWKFTLILWGWWIFKLWFKNCEFSHSVINEWENENEWKKIIESMSERKNKWKNELMNKWMNESDSVMNE